MSVGILYYSKNLVDGHSANGNCGQKLKGPFISLRKQEVQRKFSWRTVIGMLKKRKTPH